MSILQGWKAIAVWMRAQGVQACISTLKRWRDAHGLPVKRPPGHRDVYADTDELLRWKREELLRKPPSEE